jgi:hypothetical protein
MLEALLHLLIGVSIFVVVFYAYTAKNKLARQVTYIILVSIALSMALTGLSDFFAQIDFLSFMSDLFRQLSGLVVFVELVLIIYFTFIAKIRNKNTLLKGAILVYIVLVLVREFNIL